MNENTYNGWANYETWCTNLWLDNEEYTQSYCREVARDNCELHYTDNTEDEKLQAIRDTEDTIKDFVESELIPELQGLAADLLGAALSEVNWREIAEHYVNDIWEDVREEKLAELEE